MLENGLGRLIFMLWGKLTFLPLQESSGGVGCAGTARIPVLTVRH